jgi:HEAT repeat protein
MKSNLPARALAVAAMSLGFSVTTHGAAPVGTAPVPPALSPDATNALLSIDGVPDPLQLRSLIPGQTLTNLLSIAAYAGSDAGGADKDTQQSRDLIPIRLRAIRAASMFELAAGDPMIPVRRAAFKALLVANSDRTSGSSVLITQAALEALGRTGDPLDAEMISNLELALNHGSRDVRIAAVRAFRQLGPSTASTTLRNRERAERSPGVLFVIREALAALSGPQDPQPGAL